MNNPNIIIRSDFKLALNSLNRHKQTISSDKKIVSSILDYYSDDKKRMLNMLDYFTGKINKHENINLVLEDGHYASKEEYEERKEYINKQFENSNVWRMVLSIDKNLVDSNITWRDLEIKLAKEILPKFFKKMGFEDVNKMCYQFSLHTNTSHPHFHIAFLEKKPNFLNQRGEIVYKKRGKIPIEAIEYLENEVTLTIERNSKFNPLSTSINNEIEDLKQYFAPNSRNFVLYDKNNILLEEKILTLGKLISKKRDSDSRIKYNSIKDKEIKELTKEIKNELFKRNSKLSISKNEFNKKIKEMNDYLVDISKRNGINLKNIDLSYTKNKEKYLENYILNSIINHANYHYRKENNKLIYPTDIIQSIILNIYKRHKNITKKRIVINSFNNNYELTNEFRKAIHHINQEMEEAAQEFYIMSSLEM